MMASSLKRCHSSNYYEPLLTTYIKTILESALLIDEDYEVLLKASNFKINEIKPSKTVPLGLIACALTTFALLIAVAKIYDFSLVMGGLILPLMAVTTFLVILQWRIQKRREQERTVVDNLVKNFIKIKQLQSTVLQYAKTRNEMNSSELLLLNEENIKNFWKVFLEKHQELFKVMFDELEFLCSIINELSEDFIIIKQILKVDHILTMTTMNAEGVDDFKNCQSPPSIRKLQDIYIFLLSKFLNYLGITFCRNFSNNNNKIESQNQLEFLLNIKLPRINTSIDAIYVMLHKEFNNVKYCTSKKMEIVNKKNKKKTNHISGKLHQTLTGAINNLTIIMEKLQVALLRLEKELEQEKGEEEENVNDVKLLEGALSDLRDQTFTTYESLDILCKLYGILSNSAKLPANNRATNRDTPLTPIATATNNEGVVGVAKTIKYDDDDNEPKEENYELFIPETDELELLTEYKHNEDLTATNLNLMLKELRNSIKQHERFIAARHKRGINADDDDDDEEKESDRSGRRKSLEQKHQASTVPRFNLNELTGNNDPTAATTRPVPLPRSLPHAPPPPPPPPLPLSLSLQTLDSNEEQIKQSKTFLQKIMTLSKQVQQEEDVFGDSECSDTE